MTNFSFETMIHNLFLTKKIIDAMSCKKVANRVYLEFKEESMNMGFQNPFLRRV